VRAALLLGGAILAVVAGCGGGGKSAATTTVTKTLGTTNPTGTVSVTTHGRYKYPQAVTKNYMDSCTNNGAVRATYCACTLDKLSNDVSTQDFAKIGLSGGTIPPRIRRLIRRAALDCRSKL
jgi:hypothetical protein